MSADFKDRTSAELTQRYFMAALTVIREQLAIHVRGPDSGEPDGDRPGVLVAQREVERYRRALTHPAPIDMLCAVFGLGAFERDIILLCAGAELDRDIADACDAIHGTATPTLGLALTVLPGAVWGPLAPGAPLRQWRIIEVSPGARLLDRTLHLDESILHFLLGLRAMDQRLLGLFAPVRVTPSLVTSQIVVAENVAQLWSSKNSSLPIVALCGAMPLTLRAVAQLACEYGRLDLYSISAADLPDTAAEQIIAASLWERHAALTVSALLIELVGDNDSARSKAMAFVRRIQGPLLLSTAEPLPIYDRTVVRIDVPRPQQSEQRALWLKHLGEQAAEFTDVLDAVTAQFCLDGSAVAAVAAGLRARPSSAEDGDPSNGTPRTRLWRACRAQTRPRMDELAQHIEPRATFDDLIVGERQESLLREIAVHVRQRVCVYRDWGFARSSARGLGVSALFAGPSGTGKTTAAEVLAGELDLDLYRIDLSAMVRKYIG
ncbi:MAG: AAA family ATPase, partial [Myxococcota bacterium]